MKKVKFFRKTNVYLVPITKEDREARFGPLMKMARNRHRFQGRIRSCAELIEYCLKPVHREKISRVLFSCVLRINCDILRSFSVKLDEK